MGGPTAASHSFCLNLLQVQPLLALRVVPSRLACTSMQCLSQQEVHMTYNTLVATQPGSSCYDLIRSPHDKAQPGTQTQDLTVSHQLRAAQGPEHGACCRCECVMSQQAYQCPSSFPQGSQHQAGLYGAPRSHAEAELPGQACHWEVVWETPCHTHSEPVNGHKRAIRRQQVWQQSLGACWTLLFVSKQALKDAAV